MIYTYIIICIYITCYQGPSIYPCLVRTFMTDSFSGAGPSDDLADPPTPEDKILCETVWEQLFALSAVIAALSGVCVPSLDSSEAKSWSQVIISQLRALSIVFILELHI